MSKIISLNEYLSNANMAVGETSPVISIDSLRTLSTSDDRQHSRQEYTAKGIIKASEAEPIMSYSDLALMCSYLARRKLRDYAMFITGLSTGLRCVDICALKFSDVFHIEEANGTYRLTFKDAIDIIEQKTGKRTVTVVDEVIITEAMRYAITRYLIDLKCRVLDESIQVTRISKAFSVISFDGYLFLSTRNRGTQPVTVSLVYRFITEAASAVGLNIHAGTHTMRKTFLNIAYAIASSSTSLGNENAISVCQILARHSNSQTTLRYMNAAKSKTISLRRAVSDFILGKTKLKNLEVTYEWELDEE